MNRWPDKSRLSICRFAHGFLSLHNHGDAASDVSFPDINDDAPECIFKDCLGLAAVDFDTCACRYAGHSMR